MVFVQYSKGTPISFPLISVLKSLKEVEFYFHVECGNVSNLLCTDLKLSDWTSFLSWNWSSNSKNVSNISSCFSPLCFSLFYWYLTDSRFFFVRPSAEHHSKYNRQKKNENVSEHKTMSRIKYQWKLNTRIGESMRNDFTTFDKMLILQSFNHFFLKLSTPPAF